MGGLQKSKKVTWASDVNICQVKLFLSEECPSHVRTGTRDNLETKAIQKCGMQFDDILPPGFERMQPANLSRVKLSQIPLMKWKCPPTIEVNSDWQVVAGEESRETEAQNQRATRVLEAIYPRPSAIPPNPSALICVEEESIENEQNTPLVRLTPIEDEDIALDTSFSATNINPMIPKPQHSSRGTFSSPGISTTNPRAVEPDVMAAAHAALTSIMPNHNRRSLIDRELLIKILSDPKMVEQLVTNHGSSSAPQSVPSSSFDNIPILPSSIPSNMPNIPSSNTPNTHSSIMHSMPYTKTPYIPNIKSTPSRPIPKTPSSSIGSMGAKDINYYKSLIQQHGGERREIVPQFAHQSTTKQEALNIMKSRESKPKIMKPCIYFNSPRGCRNGANCPYQHDKLSRKRVSGIPKVQSAKRVKLNRGITCT
ncbi:hypothetical protein BUALT_Bualt08G0081000 [Buddleja alternifolia]|uniref:C3H1-type domain-containing protein n=1 Tax=Buddleja alternifolia TaxID=168488 RepID=A0AAV6X4M8_9LAMI|nr:hypothetical protein BUALT_Bualt08G0081000 [Buddleja alternifolia]